MSSKRSAPRRQGRKKDVQLAFEALSIEGGLLSADWLTNIAQLKADGQKEADYRVPKGLNLRDEIGRYWRIAQAGWKDFETALNAAKTGTDPRVAAERWIMALLRESFGFSSLQSTPLVELDGRKFPIGHSALGHHVPVVIASPSTGIDTPITHFGEDGKRRSAFGLAQEFLNADPNSQWGIVSDGVSLRILRDNASLTRPAWIEADLQRMFTEERYADFAAFWLICHETRFGREDRPPSDCALETWRNAGLQEGTRAREFLRRGVEEALTALGQGFLAHPDNQALRVQLQSGRLSTRDYFNQLLRLVYRLIFLLTIEERNLLHPDGTDERARKLYAQGYSLRRLREASAKRSAHDRFSDRWEAVKIVFRGLATGEPRLGIPALAGIFTKFQCPALDTSRLSNSDLLLAVLKLAWIRDESGLARVNWRDMGPEELGSVYESLLELVPQVSNEGRTFDFATGAETRGNARKTTGSYYTPDSLVQLLLDSALEPVVADTIARNPAHPVEALLNLSIVDPASGSGHFLLAAARRLAAHVARLQAGGTPSAAEYRHALRQVVGRCIYGVDLNPMAVELCKVSLWMEAVEPGLPLTFLDSHIQQGNALIGTTPDLMAGGVPNDAWQPIEGDDKKIASALKKRNKAEAEGQRPLPLFTGTAPEDETTAVRAAIKSIEQAPDTDLGTLGKKEESWQALQNSAALQHLRFVADTWCAAFVWPKDSTEYAEAAPTNGLWRQIRDRQSTVPPLLARITVELANEYSFFHWHLQFPQVFAKGGFDVVLGNPPWEVQQLSEEEFFARHDPAIAALPGNARKIAIADLERRNPTLWSMFRSATRRFAASNAVIRNCGRFGRTAVGKLNSYPLFTELDLSIKNGSGRVGIVVPSGIATDESTSEFFAHISAGQLISLVSFEEVRQWFPGTDDRRSFCLVTIGAAESAELAFGLKTLDDLRQPGKCFTLTPADIRLLNPNTLTCPTFRSKMDADITKQIFGRIPILWNEKSASGNPWGIEFRQGLFNLTSDSDLFKTSQQRGDLREPIPLYEAKMIHQFDHRWGTYSGAGEDAVRDVTDIERGNPDYEPAPRYWVDQSEVDRRLSERGWQRNWLLGFRDITKATVERTTIAAIIPRLGVGNSLSLIFPSSSLHPSLILALLANLCSLVFDFTARHKVGGTHLNFFIAKQLPVIPPTAFRDEDLSFICPRVLALVFTANSMADLARDAGATSDQPYAWDPVARHTLRAELDAYFAALYGLKRDELRYVLDPADLLGSKYPSQTFRVLKEREVQDYGEFRTGKLVLEAWDTLAAKGHLPKPVEVMT